jgi:transketolase N-terminal domain/subunit
MTPYETLEYRVLRIRLQSVRTVRSALFGFLASCLSVADILAVLVEYLQLSPAHPDADRPILSRGHAAPALYAAIDPEFFGREPEYSSLGSLHQGHHNAALPPWIDVMTGFLGNGVGAAVGLGKVTSVRHSYKNLALTILVARTRRGAGIKEVEDTPAPMSWMLEEATFSEIKSRLLDKLKIYVLDL